MGGLFDRRELSEEEARIRGKTVLEESQALLQPDPGRALKLLRLEGGRLQAAFGIGAPMHSDYRRSIVAAWERTGNPIRAPLPEARVLPWGGEPTMGDILSRVQDLQEGFIYLVAPERRQPRNAFREVEALRLMAEEPRMGFVVLGLENAVLRRGFLAEAGLSLQAEEEEILQALDDFARRTDWNTTFL